MISGYEGSNMSNHETYDDQSVFEKLEKEATRHRSGTIKSRNAGTRPIARPVQPSTDDPIGKPTQSKQSGTSDPNEAKKATFSPDRPQDPGKTMKKTADENGRAVENDKDLSGVLQKDMKDAVKRASPSVAPGKGGRRHRSRRKEKAKSRSVHRKQRRGPRWIRVTGIVMALIILAGTAGYGLVTAKLNKIVRTDGTEDIVEVDGEFDRQNTYGVEEYEPKLITSDDVTNILLIGQDRRKGDKAQMRSDSMIVCSINRATKEITLTSLMRDMYLPVPGKGYGMINATYLAGGFPLLDETIEKNFGIHIDGNVEVDFERFIGLMTLIGPIDLELSQAEADHLNQSGYRLHAGVNTLDSEQVLAYCRMRKDIGGDWGRTDRQRKVVSRIYQELKTSGLPTIYRFIDEALPLFRTDLSNRKMIQLAYAMVSDRMGIRHSYRLPEEGTYTQEIREETLHVLIPDLRENCRRLQKYIYGYLEKD